MQYLFFFPCIAFNILFNRFFSPTNLLLRNSKASGREHIDKISVPLPSQPPSLLSFPNRIPFCSHGNQWARPRMDSGPRGPQPCPTPTIHARGPRLRAGRQPGCQGNGKTPSSRPHRLRPEKGRWPRRTAASGRRRKRGRKWEGRREAWGRKRSPGPAPRTIDGRFLCCGPAHPLRPAAPLAPGKGRKC